MSEQEEWRPVPGFPDYKVSSFGRVVSYCKKTPRILSATSPDEGYPQVVVRNAERAVTRNVHQLVAEAFHGPRPTPDHEIRHLDGNPLNCRRENLTWGTHAENMKDCLRHGTHNNASKTECPQGHPYDEENTYRLPSRPSTRYCRTCQRATAAERQRRYRIRQAFRAAGIEVAA